MYNNFQDMPYSCRNWIKGLAALLFFLISASLLPAKESNTKAKQGRLIPKNIERDLNIFQKEAREYRRKGLEFQNSGNLDMAKALYQKAIELDPLYAEPYNDLGIILEAEGDLSRAEKYYLAATEVDPKYISSYTNLALFYENARDLDKAAYYWEKRAMMGLPDDPWTIKAKKRLEDIRLVGASNRPLEGGRETDVTEIVKDVLDKKEGLEKDNKGLSQEHFQKAKKLFNKSDYATALREALNALQLDPTNKEIEEFIERVQLRALSR